MKLGQRSMSLISLVIAGCCLCHAQTAGVSKTRSTEIQDQNGVRSSPAYAEVLLKKTELQADLESLVLEYTEDYPKVVEIKFSLGLIQKERERLTSVKSADISRLTLALGKLIVRKIELETELWGLRRNYKDDHPDVARAKRKVEIYEAAIKEILG